MKMVIWGTLMLRVRILWNNIKNSIYCRRRDLLVCNKNYFGLGSGGERVFCMAALFVIAFLFVSVNLSHGPRFRTVEQRDVCAADLGNDWNFSGNIHLIKESLKSSYECDGNRDLCHVIVAHGNLPTGDLKGGDARIITVVQSLREMGYRVGVYWMLIEDSSMYHYKILKDLGVDVIGPMPNSQNTLIQFLKVHNCIAVVEWLWPNPVYLRFLENMNTLVRRNSPSSAIISIADDAMYCRVLKENKMSGKETFSYVFDTEYSFWSQSDAVGVISNDVGKIVRTVDEKKPQALIPFVFSSTASLPHQPWSLSSDAVFIGFDNQENYNVVKWLIKVFQEFHLEKYLKLNIYGKVKMPKSFSNPTNCCYFHGPKSEEFILKKLSESKIFLAPVFSPVGISTKIVKAMASGVPVLTTKYGGQGIANSDNEFGVLPFRVVSENPKLFVKSLLEVIQDPILWTAMSTQGPRYVSQYFSFSPLKRNLELLIRSSVLTRRNLCGNLAEVVTRTKPIVVVWDSEMDGFSSFAIVSRQIRKSFGRNRNFSFVYYKDIDSDSTVVDVWIRYKWPVDLDRPIKCTTPLCVFIVYIPWEFGALPKSWNFSLHHNVDRIWVPSSYVSSMFTSKQVNIPKWKIQVIPHGVDCNSFSNFQKSLREEKRRKLNIPLDAFVYAYVGGLLPRKGVDALLSAWKRTFTLGNHGVRNAVLLIKTSYSHGFDQNIIKRMARNKNLRPIILDNSNESEMSEFYAVIDVLVHPTRAEGFGLTPIEAIAMNIPVIITKGGSADDYCSNQFCILVKSKKESCTQWPCRKNTLCVFPDSTKSRWDKCEELTEDPSWLDPDVKDLSYALLKAYNDYSTIVRQTSLGREFICTYYSWDFVFKLIESDLQRLSSPSNTNLVDSQCLIWTKQQNPFILTALDHYDTVIT